MPRRKEGEIAYKLRKKVEMRARRKRVEDLLLQGVTNRRELATIFGVHSNTIAKDINIIKKQWREQDAQESVDKRAERTAQIGHVAKLALMQFEESTRPAEETTIVAKHCEACGGTGNMPEPIAGDKKAYDRAAWRHYIKPAKLENNPLCEHCLKKGIETEATDVDHMDGNHWNCDWANLESLCHSCHSKKTAEQDGGFGNEKNNTNKKTKICKRCNGEGVEEIRPGIMDDCEECGGTGHEVAKCRLCAGEGKIKVETTKVKGQAGDPAFLRVAKDCFAEMARLSDLYPRNATVKKLTMSSKEVGGQIEKTIEGLYLDAPMETIIRARAVVDEIEEKMREGEASIVSEHADVIEGEAVKVSESKEE